MPAYAVILDRVPGLSLSAKSNIRKFVADRKLGKHNNPRSFSTPELAEQGIVRDVHTFLHFEFYLCFLLQVPTEFSRLKAMKCTIILKESFSDKLHTRCRYNITVYRLYTSSWCS